MPHCPPLLLLPWCPGWLLLPIWTCRFTLIGATIILYLGAVVGVASYWMSRSVWLVGRNQQESWGITFCGVPPPSYHTAMGSKYRNIRQRQRVANFPNAFQMSTSEDQLLLSTVNNNWLRHKGHLLARPVLWQLLWQPLQDSTVGSLAFDCKGKTSDFLYAEDIKSPLFVVCAKCQRRWLFVWRMLIKEL